MADVKKSKRPGGMVTINVELCKGCGFCIAFCPVGALELSDRFNSKGYHSPRVVNLDACTGCDLCGMYCPDFAIFGERVTKEAA